MYPCVRARNAVGGHCESLGHFNISRTATIV